MPHSQNIKPLHNGDTAIDGHNLNRAIRKINGMANLTLGGGVGHTNTAMQGIIFPKRKATETGSPLPFEISSLGTSNILVYGNGVGGDWVRNGHIAGWAGSQTNISTSGQYWKVDNAFFGNATTRASKTYDMFLELSTSNQGQGSIFEPKEFHFRVLDQADTTIKKKILDTDVSSQYLGIGEIQFNATGTVSALRGHWENRPDDRMEYAPFRVVRNVASLSSASTDSIEVVGGTWFRGGSVNGIPTQPLDTGTRAALSPAQGFGQASGDGLLDNSNDKYVFIRVGEGSGGVGVALWVEDNGGAVATNPYLKLARAVDHDATDSFRILARLEVGSASSVNYVKSIWQFKTENFSDVVDTPFRLSVPAEYLSSSSAPQKLNVDAGEWSRNGHRVTFASAAFILSTGGAFSSGDTIHVFAGLNNNVAPSSGTIFLGSTEMAGVNNGGLITKIGEADWDATLNGVGETRQFIDDHIEDHYYHGVFASQVTTDYSSAPVYTVINHSQTGDVPAVRRRNVLPSEGTIGTASITNGTDLDATLLLIASSDVTPANDPSLIPSKFDINVAAPPIAAGAKAEDTVYGHRLYEISKVDTATTYTIKLPATGAFVQFDLEQYQQSNIYDDWMRPDSQEWDFSSIHPSGLASQNKSIEFRPDSGTFGGETQLYNMDAGGSDGFNSSDRVVVRLDRGAHAEIGYADLTTTWGWLNSSAMLGTTSFNIQHWKLVDNTLQDDHGTGGQTNGDYRYPVLLAGTPAAFVSENDFASRNAGLILGDASGFPSLHTEQRDLKDSSGITSLAWETRQCMDVSDETMVDWGTTTDQVDVGAGAADKNLHVYGNVNLASTGIYQANGTNGITTGGHTKGILTSEAGFNTAVDDRVALYVDLLG